MEVSGDFNAKLYVPGNINYSCCYTNGNSIYCLRTRNANAYNTRDIFNTDLSYVRYTDSVYIGSSSNYNCIESSRITNNVFYRVDLANIIIVFAFISLVPLLFVNTLHKRFRKR